MRPSVLYFPAPLAGGGMLLRRGGVSLLLFQRQRTLWYMM